MSRTEFLNFRHIRRTGNEIIIWHDLPEPLLRTNWTISVPDFQSAAPAGLDIAPGDKITCGTVTATVLDVHDNRGHPAPHWYVEAS